ncbi:unnamed protein product [Rhodiola kirilowii]
MFPFHRGDELFEIPSPTHSDYNNINNIQHQNLQEHYHNNLISSMSTTAAAAGSSAELSFQIPRAARSKSAERSKTAGGQQVPSVAEADHLYDDSAKNERDRRKVLHREIERQRRQDMSNLYSSLRSQLPVEYIKGKRSISDHMNEAVNYIKHQENRIRKLSLKRDELRRISTNDATKDSSSFGSTSSPSIFVQAGKCWGGVEIVITRGFVDPKTPLPISRVLHTLQEDGFNVHGYVSATMNDSVVYTIQAQVGDDTCLDLPRLEEKLFDIISSSQS